MYEEHAHRALCSDQSNACPIRELKHNPTKKNSISKLLGRIVEKKVKLSHMRLFEFDSLDDVHASAELQVGRYCKPISASFGAIDCIIGIDAVGNMTLRLHDGISLTALLQLVIAMGFDPLDAGVQKPILSLYWMLPTRALYDAMRVQPYTVSGVIADAAHPYRIDLDSRVQVKQFAVLVKVSSH
jgi:hypothetical protein